MMQGSHRNGMNFRPRAAAARALRSVRHAVARGWRGALAVVLAMLLVWQSAGSSGVAYAITAGAQTIAAATSKMIEDTPADETETPAVTDGTTTGGSSEETTDQDGSTAAVQSVQAEPGDQTEPSDAEETATDGTATEKTEVADASTTDTNGSTTAQVAGDSDASEQNEQTTVDESTAPGNTDEPADTADEPATTDDAEELQATPRDWTGMVNNLKLSTPDRLVIDTDAVAQLVKQSIAAAAEAQEATVGEQAADDQAADDQTSSDQANDGQAATDKTADQEAANNTQAANDPAATGPSTTSVGNAAEPAEITLPDELPATLSLAFELDPTADPQQDAAAKDAAAHTTVIANDTFEVTLPAGVTLANTDPFDVYQCNDQNKDTTVRIAKATPSADGTKLTIKFVDAVDTATSETYYLGAPSDDELAEHPGTVFATAKARLALDVKVDAELIGDEATTVEWTLQQPAADVTGEAQKATLELPARDDLIASLDLEATEPADTEDATSEEEPAETEDTASVAEDAKNGVLEVEEDTKTALSAVQELNRALIMLLADNGATAPGPSYAASDFNESFSFTTQWADNHSDGRPSEEEVNSSAKLYFTYKGTTYEFTQENAKQYLGMSESQYEKAAFRTSSPTINSTLTEVSGLPTKVTITTYKLKYDAQDFPIPDASSSTGWAYEVASSNSYDVTWEYKFDSASLAGDAYYTSFSAKDEYHPTDTYYFQLLDPNIKFNLQLKAGTLTFDDFSDVNDAELYLEYVVNNEEHVLGEYSVSKLLNDSELRAELGIKSIEWDEENNQILVNAPRYTTDGSPIEWRIRYVRTNTQTDDYYLATYDNSKVPNRGTDVSAAYNGGTVIITHAGETTFNADKVWLDNGDAAGLRKQVTFSLWRYSGDGKAATASQVRDANGDFVTITVNPDDAEDGVVHLGDVLKDQYEGLKLDKYDSDGYPFVYGIREDTQLAGYETVFGSVNAETGEVHDEGPNYIDSKGDKTSFNPNYQRDDTDRLTYNGGTVSNRLKDTTTVTATKTWSIAAFADQVKDITCTFTLQKQVADEGADGGFRWEPVLDASGKPITKELNGFSAEQLTHDVSGTYDKYDANGNEIVYRWVESGVTQGTHTADETDFESTDDGSNATFYLYLRTSATNEDSVEKIQFTSTMTVDEDTGKQVITNTFDNSTYEKVEKKWQQKDGTYDYKQVDYPDLTHECTVNLYQGTTLIGTFVLDGVVDDESHPQTDGLAEGFDGVDVYENEPYRLNIDNLPLYAADGSRYVYRVVEEQPEGWHSTRTYDAEKHLTTIENSHGPGEGTDFHLIKEWVDGEDAAHRLESHVRVVVAKNIYNSQKQLVYSTGEVLYGEGGKVSENDLVLSESNNWFLEFTVPGANNVKWQQLKVEETELYDQTTRVSYPVVDSPDEAREHYTEDTEWINKGWDDQYPQNQYPRVATEDHVYEVTAAGKDAQDEGTFGEQLLEVRNRRLGLVDLTVQKNWQDEGADENNRPDAQLKLTVDDPGATFSYDAEGNVVIQLTNGNKLPIFKDEGEVSQERYTKSNATIVDGGKALVVSVDKEGESSTYYFSGLPKYTGDGNVVHYTVSEEWVGDHGDYSSSVTAEEYKVGLRHFHDTQVWIATNRRAGTTKVHFHKQWKDTYINEGATQRPDIYLTLYEVRSDNDYKPRAVETYVHWLWTADPEESSSEEESDATTRASQYAQTCTIEGLQKYDSNGFEIIYYASEDMASNGKSMGYSDVTFDLASIDANSDAFANLLQITDGDGHATTGSAKRDDASGTAVDDEAAATCAGSRYAVRAGGTFQNALEGTVSVEGTKIWENVPGTPDPDDLPPVLIVLQRRLAAGADGVEHEWPAVYIQQDENGNWEPVEHDGTCGAVAWTSDLHQLSGTTFGYTMSHEGENAYDPNADSELARYNEDGELYEYRAVEIITGLFGTDALKGTQYEDVTNIPNINFSEIYNNHHNNVYVVQHGEAGSFLLRNSYQPLEGSLTVKKLFDGQRDDSDAYPDVTFTVYRHLEDASSPWYTPEMASSVTIPGEDFAAAIANEDHESNGLTYSEETGFTYTFTNLDIYAPNGDEWSYYVVESPIDGYDTTVGVGDLKATSDSLTTGKAIPDNDDNSVVGTGSGYLVDSNGSTLVKPVKDDGAWDTAVDVTFKNSYHHDTLTLTGTKVWDDYNNAFGTRPQKINLKVERYTEGIKSTVILDTSKPEGGTEGGAGTSEDAAPKLTWTKNGATDSEWKYEISNLEMWASDGNAWTYKVTETLPDGTTSYRIITGTATGSGNAKTKEVDKNTGDISYTGTVGNLSNGLSGSVKVTKNWNDNENQWNLRPVSVVVELQMRHRRDAGEWSSWESADLTFNGSLPSGTLSATQTLSSSNGWSYTWSNVPTQVVYGTTVYEVEYRVIETQMQMTQTSKPVGIPEPVDGEEGSGVLDYVTYEETLSYTGEGTTKKQETTSKDTGSYRADTTTELVNTLKDTQLTIKKEWDDDSNLWGLRDTVTNEAGVTYWVVTYRLQRRTVDDASDPATYGEWEFVEDIDGEGLTSTMRYALDTDEGTLAFENLPLYNEKHQKYEYRAVEVVPGGYDAMQYTTDGETLKAAESVGDPESSDETLATVDGSSLTGASEQQPDTGEKVLMNEQQDQPEEQTQPQQVFVNSTKVIDFGGTKTWEDYGISGLVPADENNDGKLDNVPTLTLERTTTDPTDPNVDVDEIDWEPVLYQSGEHRGESPQPIWKAGQNRDDDWTWVYKSLPQTDGDNHTYYYRAVETDGSVAGFYDASKNGGTYYEKDDDGDQTAIAINNVATRFTLDKIGDNDETIDQSDGTTLELAVMNTSGDTVYAVWKKAPDETSAQSWVWPGGVAVSEVWKDGKTGNGGAITEGNGAVEVTENPGDIIGLPAGTYIVRETGELPEWYARMQDVTFTMGTSGVVAVADASKDAAEVATDDNGITLTVEDPIFRGYFIFTKVLGSTGQTGIEDATFDLYQQVGDKPDLSEDSSDKLLVTGITADSDGTFVSKTDKRASGDEYAYEEAAGYNTDGEHANLAAGLLPGTYYLVETGTSDSAYLPEGEDVMDGVFAFTINQETDHDRAVTVKDNATDNPDNVLINEPFTASVKLTKYDTLSRTALSDATFELQYKATDAKEFSTLSTGHTTSSDGTLTLTLNAKGTYRLVETANQGYEVDEDNPLTIEFTLGNEDYRGEFDLTKESARDALDMDENSITGDAGNNLAKGVGNDRKPGSVTFTKTGEDGEGLSGATFTLQWRENGHADWEDVLTDLVSGTSYTLSELDEPLTAENLGSLQITGSTTDDVAAGALTVNNIPWNEGTSQYRFVETAPAPGYESEKELAEAIEDGRIATQPFQVNRTNVNATLGSLSNTANDLTIRKVDEAGNALSGATFRVTPVGDSRFATADKDQDYTAPRTYATGKDASTVSLKGELVADNTYKLEEIKAPAGYTIPRGSFIFTMEKDGTITPAATGNDSLFSAAKGAIVVTASDRPISVTLYKKGDNGDKLAGAVFSLEPADGSTFADGSTEAMEITVNENGIALKGLLANNTYVLTEVTPPVGYEQLAEPLTFTVDEHGAITQEGSNSAFKLANNESAATATITATNTQLVVQLAKTNENGDPLPGASFTITPAEGSAFATGTNTTAVRTFSDAADGTEDGIIKLAGELVAGNTYTIAEATAPDGYELAGQATFTVGTDGTLTIQGATDGTFTPTDGSGTYAVSHENGLAVMTVRDTPVQITVTKATGNNGTTKLLPGAEFTLTELLLAGSEDQPQTFTKVTDSSGAVTFTGLKAGSQYQLAETKAPAGYERVSDTLTFKVTQQGTIEVQGEQPAAFTLNGENGQADSVRVMNNMLGITLMKQGMEGQPLAGAVFTLAPAEGTFLNGDKSKTFTSNEFGTVFADLQLEGAAEGRAYVLTETAPPAGYQLADPVTFLVFEDGSVQLASDTAEATANLITIDNEKESSTITMKNESTRFTINKVDDQGNAIKQGEGETLELAVLSTDGQTVHAVWQKSSDGTVSTWLWPGDGAPVSAVWPAGTGNGGANTAGATHMAGDDAGQLVGLAQGTYQLVETGALPTGYARMVPVTFSLDAEGLLATTSEDASVSDDQLTLTVQDPIFRSYFAFTKLLNTTPVEGATFDLYLQNGDEPDVSDNSADTLVVRGITTDENGVFSSQDAVRPGGGAYAYEAAYADDAHASLADGLLPGTYYLRETATSDGAYLPQDDNAADGVYGFTIDQERDHNGTVTVADNDSAATQLTNDAFGAALTLHKIDAVSHEAVEGATFALYYADEARALGSYTTDDEGNPTIPAEDLNRKGTYRLVETANAGYVVDEERPLTITFTLGNEDHARTFDLTDANDRAAIDATVTNNPLTSCDDGVANTRQPGSVTFVKTGEDGAGLSGATFTLQWRANADDVWHDAVTGLVSGNTYTLGELDEPLTAENLGSLQITGNSTTDVAAGALTINNLPWSDGASQYRLVETVPAPGYESEQAGVDDGTIATNAFAPDRTHLSIDLGMLGNTANELTIRKVDEAGSALTGAVFRVTPAKGSAFATADSAGSTTAARTYDTGDAPEVALTGDLVAGNTYTLEEVTGPEGYAAAQGTLTFTMHKDGTIEQVGTGNDALFRVENGGITVVATNRPISVTLVKKGNTGSDDLAGATFELTPAKGSAFVGGSTDAQIVTTGANGQVELAGLVANNTYTLRETVPPAGYELLADELTFTVDAHGNITAAEGTSDAFALTFDADQATATITVTDTQLVARFAKTDQDGAPLAGATFQIAPAEGSSFATGSAPTSPRQYTVDDDGTFELVGELVVGDRYTISELTAPAHYELAGTVTFTVNEDGSLALVDADEDGAVTPTDGSGTYVTTHDSAGIALMTVRDTPVELTVYKVAGADGKKAYLPDATFTLTEVLAGDVATDAAPDGATDAAADAAAGAAATTQEPQVLTGTTNSDGAVVFSGLTVGARYELTETAAPDGYELLAGTLTIEVTADGTVRVVGALPAGFALNEAADAVEVTDHALGVSLVKTGTNGQALAGAEFTLAPVEGTFVDGTASKTFTSDAFGAVFTDLQLAGSEDGRAYVLTETAPPAGYTANDPVTFVVYEDGTVQLGDATDEATAARITLNNEAESAVMTMQDEAIELALRKVSTGGAALEGAQFTLTGPLADGSTSAKLTVGNGGTIDLPALVAGEQYELAETAAPKGYELIDGTYTFAVTEDGLIEAADTAEPGLLGQRSAGYYVDEDGTALVAVDAATPLIEQLKDKLSQTGDSAAMLGYVAAAGALFVIAGVLHGRRRRKE